MKKVLSVLMAGAMVAGMSMSAFAASNNVEKAVYDADGEKINIADTGDVYGKAEVEFLGGQSKQTISYNIDGVVPGITMYIPLGKEMSAAITDGSAGTTIEASAVAEKLGTTATNTPTVGDFYLNKAGDDVVKANGLTVDLDRILSKLAINSSTALTDITDESYVLSKSGSGSDFSAVKVTDHTEAAPAGAVEDPKVSGNYYVVTDAQTVEEAAAAIAATVDTDDLFEKAYNDAKGYYPAADKDAVDAARAKVTPTGSNEATYKISLDSLTNKDYFKFKVDKDDGSKYINKIEVVDDKKMSNLNTRTAFLKVILNDSQTTSDLKSNGKVTFTPKDKSDSFSGSKKVTNGDVWGTNDVITINYTFWLNNMKKSNDANVETGDRVYFDPDDNEDNTLVWGDDRAALYFESNDDANKFYARLQTKADSEIYSVYGDPLNAELWFYDFVGNPTIPSTSRATLTLGIPWDDDDDYTPNPHDCYIYEKDADGNLIDVTSKFTYDEDNDGTTDIEGWTIKTRTLGTYIVSDTELDTTIADDDVTIETPDDNDDASTTDGGKEIPNTGSSDMVGAAVVAAVVSLAAAGAVAFKKASK